MQLHLEFTGTEECMSDNKSVGENDMERLTRKSQIGDMVWFVDHENSNMDLEPCEMNPHHNRLAIQKLAAYEDAEEQGLLLRLPCKVEDVVDKLFSHNEIISLWQEVKEETTYHKRIWYGMAWDIPEELKNCKFVKIFGTIPESIVHADIINIEVVLSEETEAALKKMKGE